MRKTTSCKETQESPGCFSSLIGQKNVFSGQSETGDSKTSSLDLKVNFHHEHCIVPTICPWVSEDGSPQKHCNFTGTELWYYQRGWVTCGCVRLPTLLHTVVCCRCANFRNRSKVRPTMLKVMLVRLHAPLEACCY